jgi:RNA polymerase sigma factor (sigma-70 family)
MLTEKEAHNLMDTLISLKKQFAETQDRKIETKLKKHEQLCIDKFRYLISMRTHKYRSFNNYEDLNQEGYEALLKAMLTFQPSKGSFFSWAHHYISTRISRSANLHTTIRYPLQVAKKTPPHKENDLPTQIEEKSCPDVQLETNELSCALQDAMNVLSPQQQNILYLAYGFDGGKPLSINKICEKYGLTRIACHKIIDASLGLLRENDVINEFHRNFVVVSADDESFDMFDELDINNDS